MRSLRHRSGGDPWTVGTLVCLEIAGVFKLSQQCVHDQFPTTDDRLGLCPGRSAAVPLLKLLALGDFEFGMLRNSQRLTLKPMRTSDPALIHA